MKNSKTITLLVCLIAILALVAAGLGVLWQGNGTHFDFKSLQGQVVTMQGDGLYRNDSVANASQEIAQDIVTLVVGLPLLLVSLVLFQKNLLRGKLLLSGTLAYFLYTYTSYVFGSTYNILFLVYVALFSLSLFALILTLMTIEVTTLPLHFSNKLPRKTISVFLFLLASFLLVAWTGMIIPPLFANRVPEGLANSSTLFIQAMDLGLVVPLGFLAGVLLLKRNCWGYLLSSVFLFKGFTMGAALTAMVIGQLLAGVEIALVQAIIFPAIALGCVVLTGVLLKNISEKIIPGSKVVVARGSSNPRSRLSIR